MDRTLTAGQKALLAAPIASQLHVPAVDVLQSFQYHGWRIVYVDSHAADEAFLFFAGDPVTQHLVTLWSGAAQRDEGPTIRRWALAHAPGIPRTLAACFAWRVTRDRDR